MPENITEQNKFISRTQIYWGEVDKLLTTPKSSLDLLGETGNQLIYKLITFILGDDYFNKYSRISRSNVAPHFHSLLLAYLSIVEQLNKSIMMVNLRGAPERVKIKLIDTGFSLLLQKLPQYKELLKNKPENDKKQLINEKKEPQFINSPENVIVKFDESLIKWLKKKPRACYWFWFKLMITLYPNNIPLENPASTERRYKIINNYYTNSNSQSLYFQNLEPLKLKYDWDNYISRMTRKTNFLENLSQKDKTWAIDYLRKAFKSKKYVIMECEPTYFDMMILSIENDPTLSFNIFIDNWSADIETKNKFLEKMKNAWNRRNCPDRKLKLKKKNSSNDAKATKIENKKCIIEVDQDTHGFLFLLAEENNRTIEDELKVLVEEATNKN